MATAFAATNIYGPHPLCPGIKVAMYKMQLPSSTTEAGEAWDLSADFNYIYGAIFGNSGVAVDHAVKLDLIGTYATTGVVASGISVVEHMNAETATNLPIVTAATDLSACNDMIVIVFGV